MTAGLWQGEMVLRDGERFAEDDVLFRVQGLFVEETGRLHAVADSSAPLMHPTLEPADFKDVSYSYRQASCLYASPPHPLTWLVGRGVGILTGASLAIIESLKCHSDICMLTGREWVGLEC